MSEHDIAARRIILRHLLAHVSGTTSGPDGKPTMLAEGIKLLEDIMAHPMYLDALQQLANARAELLEARKWKEIYKEKLTEAVDPFDSTEASRAEIYKWLATPGGPPG